MRVVRQLYRAKCRFRFPQMLLKALPSRKASACAHSAQIRLDHVRDQRTTRRGHRLGDLFVGFSRGIEFTNSFFHVIGLGAGHYLASLVSGYKSNRISWLELSSNSDWESNASNTSKMGTFSRLVMLKICRIW